MPSYYRLAFIYSVGWKRKQGNLEPLVIIKEKNMIG